MALAPDWNEGRGLTNLLERFTASRQWDDAGKMITAYERHNTQVRKAIPPERLLVWDASQGWEPICRALGLPVAEIPFPWVNRRSDWNK
jgi:hypothetical protein